MGIMSRDWQTGTTLEKETPMPEALSDAPDASELHAITGMPTFERLSSEAALQPCDGHASGAVNAIVTLLLAGGQSVLLCGHCARRAGYEHTDHTPEENRAKGSDH